MSSSKTTGARPKRPDKDGQNAESKGEGDKAKVEGKPTDNAGKRGQDKFQRPDRGDSRYGRDKGPPPGRSREKEERGGGWKKRDWVERGPHRGGRLDLSGHRAGVEGRRDDRSSHSRDRDIYMDKKSGNHDPRMTI